MLLEAGPFEAHTGRKLLYRDVFISLKEREFVLLQGPSGAGKTTLLRQLVGLLPAQGARRVFLGEEFLPEDLPRFRRYCLLLPANAPMLLGSIRENLLFPFKHKLARGTFKASKASELWKELGLGDLRWEQDVGSLSLGERHRLALVRALLWEPHVILADEPFSGLDKENFGRAWQALFKFSQKGGRAVLCVSHGEVGPGVSRTLVLEGQRIREQRP